MHVINYIQPRLYRVLKNINLGKNLQFIENKDMRLTYESTRVLTPPYSFNVKYSLFIYSENKPQPSKYEHVFTMLYVFQRVTVSKACCCVSYERLGNWETFLTTKEVKQKILLLYLLLAFARSFQSFKIHTDSSALVQALI